LDISEIHNGPSGFVPENGVVQHASKNQIAMDSSTCDPSNETNGYNNINSELKSNENPGFPNGNVAHKPGVGKGSYFLQNPNQDSNTSPTQEEINNI
jgi:hypothetical protein